MITYLRHNGIGTADPAVCADETSGNELFIRTVEYNRVVSFYILEHLNILYRHRRIFYTDHIWIFQHFFIKWDAQRHTCKLRDIVNNKVCIWSCAADIIPVLRDRMIRKMEINRRDRSDGINSKAFCVSCKLLAVCRIVAGYMGDTVILPFAIFITFSRMSLRSSLL